MAITQEKKRRQRGKNLNLLGEEEASIPQFFSPQRVLIVKAYQEGKEEAEEEEKHRKAIRKKEAANKCQKLQAEEQKRAVQCQLRPEANRKAKQQRRHKKH